MEALASGAASVNTATGTRALSARRNSCVPRLPHIDDPGAVWRDRQVTLGRVNVQRTWI